MKIIGYMYIGVRFSWNGKSICRLLSLIDTDKLSNFENQHWYSHKNSNLGCFSLWQLYVIVFLLWWKSKHILFLKKKFDVVNILKNKQDRPIGCTIYSTYLQRAACLPSFINITFKLTNKPCHSQTNRHTDRQTCLVRLPCWCRYRIYIIYRLGNVSKGELQTSDQNEYIYTLCKAYI